MPHSSVVPAPRRATSIAAAAAALAVGVVLALLFLVGPLGTTARDASSRPCSSYPTPGTLAAAGTRVPTSLAAQYSLLADPQRPVDQLRPDQVAGLRAAGLIMSGTRFLGVAASGGRIYLVPAEHLLSFPLAPARCLSPLQRAIEGESLPVLRNEYRDAALCIEVLYSRSRLPNLQDCAPASGTPYALVSTDGTPGFGLVPNGIHAVTVTYQTAPPRTVAVSHNSFLIVEPSQTAPPCGVQWLDATGNVKKIAVGCSYLTPELHAYYEYRAYVAGKLSTLRSQLAALAAAIASGSLASARSAWLTAHLTWLEIGQDDGAYGAFGALGGQIGGLAAGHPLGTSDPGFTGFHRVEFDLWTEHELTAAARDTAALQHLLAKLTAAPLSSYLPATATGIGNWLLRPHEALEDALRDSLTAEDDYGSGTDLASVTADVSAVREMLSELEPALHPVAPNLIDNARAQLDSLIRAIDASRADGQWVAIADLPVRQRQQVDADTGAALETLAPIPDLVTSTGTNSPGD